jgi:hypothetical protein
MESGVRRLRKSEAPPLDEVQKKKSSGIFGIKKFRSK